MSGRKAPKGRRRKPAWPQPAVPFEGIALGVDPGPTRCGWCFVEFGPAWPVPRVLGAGHDDVEDLLAILRSQKRRLALVAVEAIVPHSRGGIPSANRATIGTEFAIGRIAEAARGIPFVQLPRRNVIRQLTGSFPAPGTRVSKGEMQEVVRERLELDEPIRPQHANDACCVALAVVAALEEAAEEAEA